MKPELLGLSYELWYSHRYWYRKWGKGSFQLPILLWQQQSYGRKKLAKTLLSCALAVSVFLCNGVYGIELTETKSFGDNSLQMPVTIEVSGSCCYVMEAATGSVNQFSLNGKWIRSISGRGQGPGKLANPNAFHVEADTLYILNYLPPQLAVFNVETGHFEYVMSIPVGNAMGMAMTGTDCFILTNGLGKSNGDGKLVIKMKVDGKHLERQFEFKNALSNIGNPSLANQGVCTVGAGLVTFAFVYGNEIVQFDMNGNIVSSNHLPVQIQGLKIQRRGNQARYSKGTITDMKTVGKSVWILANETGSSPHSALFSYDRGKVVRLYTFDRELRSFAVEGQDFFAVDQGSALVRVYKIGKN